MDELSEELNEEGAGEQRKSRGYNLRPWQFKPGQSGNPSGRPKGSVSLKEWAKNMLQTMTDDERLEFLKGLDKDKIWEMAEGKADSKTDITSAGERLMILPSEIANKNELTQNPKSDSE